MTNETASIEIAGAQITIPTADLFRAWLAQHVAPTAVVTTATWSDLFFPMLNPGEEYAGFILGKNGERGHHLILLPGEIEDSNWEASQKWATSVGGDLPSRREQSQLFSNLKEHFKGAWYWSNEQYSADTDYAWSQNFTNGFQNDGH